MLDYSMIARAGVGLYSGCMTQLDSDSVAITSDVIISGGGIIGQTLALALAQHGLRVVIVDRAASDTAGAGDRGAGASKEEGDSNKNASPNISTNATDHPSFDGRTTAVASASWAMLRLLGVREYIAAQVGPIHQICPIHQIKVSDGLKAGSITFTPKPAATKPTWYGAEDGAGEDALGYMVENHLLRAALVAAVAARDDSIYLCAPAQVIAQDFSSHGVCLTTADGQILRAPLLVVAEGGRSTTAQALGFKYAHWEYRQQALVGAIRHSKPHHHIAYEIFYPSGPVATLPLCDLALCDLPPVHAFGEGLDSGDRVHRSAYVWSIAADQGRALAKLGPRGFACELAQRIGGMLGEIALIAPRQSYPLGYRRTAQLVGPRVALVGDSAHMIHPIAGQGVNLGWRDVAALTEILVTASRLGLDLGDATVLSRYQRWRGGDVMMTSAAIDGLVHLFGVSGRGASALRRAGMAAVERNPRLKNFTMARARGEVGRMPRLLEGIEI